MDISFADDETGLGLGAGCWLSWDRELVKFRALGFQS